MNELVYKHKCICDELNGIYEKKNHDYGNSFGETFDKLGIVSAVTRISDKTNRLMSLCKTEARVDDESITDTLMDLANYCIMTVMELDDVSYDNHEYHFTMEPVEINGDVWTFLGKAKACDISCSAVDDEESRPWTAYGCADDKE